MTAHRDDDFLWRTIAPEEAALVHALHLRIIADTPAGMVRPDPLSHFEQHTRALGRILGCFAGQELVAYGVLGVGSATVRHLAELLALNAADSARLCALDGAASLPAWRGRRLHGAAIAERGELARALGHTLVAATVAPENLRSLRGLLKEGYTIQRYALVYGGLARLVTTRDLLRPVRDWTLVTRVPLADHPGHQRALADGLTGYGCWRDTELNWHIQYGRPFAAVDG